MIELSGVNAGYGRLVVLHDLSLRFAAGRMTAVLGANGSGKSTLLKTIFGMTQIFSGEMRFDGSLIKWLPTEQINRLGIAYVPQRLNVFTGMTVNDNLRLAVRAANRNEAAARLAAAHELFPILKKRGVQLAGLLSGGERQMVAIALGWLSRPKMMLLDEPTAGLSPLVAGEVFATLKRLLEDGMTLAVVEQNARSAVKHADEVVVLREGQVVYADAAAAFAADEERARDYLGIAKIG